MECGASLQRQRLAWHSNSLSHTVFSWGNCPWIMGPWQWQAAQAPERGGVDSDLCLHTGFLVAVLAALESHALLWGLC